VTQRYVCTYAQNLTPVHAKLWETLQVYCKDRKATLLVVPGTYKNPTSRWSQEDQDQQVWAPEVEPYLYSRRIKLCPNLCLYADVSVQPTAARPLSGFEVFCGGNSAIFGHPKRALETVPTASRIPRILTTTGSCTVANYSRSKAGKKGHAHHTLGALVVEISDDGIYHLRHISACADGSFIDLDTEYTPEGARPAPPALAITFGDIHVGRDDAEAEQGHYELCQRLKPRYSFLHDTLDFRARNHHDKSMRSAHEKVMSKIPSANCVRQEVHAAGAKVRSIASWGFKRTYIARSNHDLAFERWLEECDPKRDPANAKYYFQVWARMFEHFDGHGSWAMAFELESRRMFRGQLRTVRFLREDETLRTKGVRNGMHGHNGPGGSRGTLLGYAKLGEKTVTGHGHAPGIVDGAYRTGVFGSVDHGYNRLPSGWLVADVVQYSNGKRALIVLVKGRFTA